MPFRVRPGTPEPDTKVRVVATAGR